MYSLIRNGFWIAALCVSARAQSVAPDPTGPGPYTVSQGDYALPAAVDSTVLPGCIPHAADPANYVMAYDCKTQIKGRIYYPQALSGRYPVVVMLHGNHATCGHMYRQPPGGFDTVPMTGSPRIDEDVTFTGSGVCSNPRNPLEAPSYLGFEYLATKLAAWGYIVVSVDANRGINGASVPDGVTGDTSLIRARGALVLRNIQTLSTWNLNGSTPATVGAELKGHMDFTNLGLMGHSRGGEGVRAAYNLYRNNTGGWRQQIAEALTFKGLFEIAPTDQEGLYSSTGITWGVLVAMCDGDVARIDGMKVFDRTFLDSGESPALQKSVTTVWGANHNFFNTQWQVSDATFEDGTPFCAGEGNDPLYGISPGSTAQQIVAATAVMAFFRGNVGASADITFNRVFNPPFGIPGYVAPLGTVTPYPTRSDRLYRPPGETRIVEDFSGPTGTSAYGVQNDAGHVQVLHTSLEEHDPSLKTGLVIWSSAGPATFFQTNWVPVNQIGTDVRRFRTLDIRVSRLDDGLTPPDDFSIRLVGSNGVMTRAVRASAYTDPNFAGASSHRSALTLPPAAMNYDEDPYQHVVMQTIRIPLTDFGNYAYIAQSVRGIRLTFDQTASGMICLGNIQFSAQVDGGGSNFPSHLSTSGAPLISEGRLGTTSSLSALTRTLSGPMKQRPSAVHSATIAGIRRIPALPHGGAGYRIEISNPQGFPIRNSVQSLAIGERRYTSSSGATGNLKAVFTISEADFAGLSTGMPVRVQYGGSTREYWDCGTLNLGIVDR